MGIKISTLALLLAVLPFCKAQVVFTEIMFDPTPVVGLPNAEYVEIYNYSIDTISLYGWAISDASSSKMIDSTDLPPGEFALLTDKDDVELFSTELLVVGVEKLPSLNNGGDVLTLTDEAGTIIDHLTYDDKWHTDKEKDDGGHSIENGALNHCHTRSNWQTSRNNTGGTPGQTNSFKTTTVVRNELLSSMARNDTIFLLFSQNLFPSHLPENDNLFIDGASISDFTIEESSLTIPNQKGKFIDLTDLKSCDFSLISAKEPLVTPSKAFSGNIIINEIMFDPDKDGIEFLEIYNPTLKGFDLRDIMIRSKKEDESIKSVSRLSERSRLIYPGQYLVLSDNADLLKGKHPQLRSRNVLETNLPSLTNTYGHFELIANERLIDSALYYPDYQSTFYDYPKGVSLERISSFSDGLDKSSWHSCSSVYYSTPGKENSQQASKYNKLSIELKEKTFSPNSDGYKDVLSFTLKAAKNYSASIRVFSSTGTFITSITENEILGSVNHFTWDGKTENNALVAPGFYIIAVNYSAENMKSGSIKKAIAVEY